MSRCIGCLFAVLFAAALAQAHFPFIVPDAEGTTAKVVFSDSLAPDTDVAIDAKGNLYGTSVLGGVFGGGDYRQALSSPL